MFMLVMNFGSSSDNDLVERRGREKEMLKWCSAYSPESEKTYQRWNLSCCSHSW